MSCYQGDVFFHYQIDLLSSVICCFVTMVILSCSITKMLKKDAEDLITTHELIQLLLLKERHHQHCTVKPSESSQPLGKEEEEREGGSEGGRRE